MKHRLHDNVLFYIFVPQHHLNQIANTEPVTANDLGVIMQKSAAANIDSLKADLKSKKTEIKKLDKELTHLAEKKDEADKKAADAAAEKEAVDLVKKALANGTTVDDILELLK